IEVRPRGLELPAILENEADDNLGVAAPVCGDRFEHAIDGLEIRRARPGGVNRLVEDLADLRRLRCLLAMPGSERREVLLACRCVTKLVGNEQRMNTALGGRGGLIRLAELSHCLLGLATEPVEKSGSLRVGRCGRAARILEILPGKIAGGLDVAMPG